MFPVYAATSLKVQYYNKLAACLQASNLGVLLIWNHMDLKILVKKTPHFSLAKKSKSYMY